ncbi:MAG TPA: CooT family nickel-binding protein [Syntrophomonadaceae bacterium]|nr:CooT family nickel-binding protein [Syntrophomonadaceae bacterium]
MCEAHAYLRLDDEDELFFENVDRVEPQDDCLVLENIFGQRKIIKARIKELALVDHKIILEKVEQEKKINN